MSLATRSVGRVVSISMVTGGSGYSSQPSVTISGGNGSGAQAVAHMAGTMVESIVITNAGSGYTAAPSVIIDGNAQATASVYAGDFRPAVFLRSRFNDMYVIDGMGRGLRWNGTAASMQPIGISKPSKGPSLSATTDAGQLSVGSVSIIRPGAGYTTAPAVSFSGGSPSTSATATATIFGGRVTAIKVTDAGAGYSTAPTVTLSGGCATGASFNVGVRGSVADMTITSGGTGYTTAPTVVFSSAQGLTQANAIVDIAEGQVTSVTVLAGGTGATTTGVTASLTGGGGTGAAVSVRMAYSVSAVTVAQSGSGFFASPVIAFRPDTSDTTFSSAAATGSVNSSGNITGVTLLTGGRYTVPPTAEVLDGTASATANMLPRMTGKYKCCVRYLDDTPVKQKGPIPSSISELVEVDAASSAGKLTWTFSHAGIEDRVTAMELWRTSSNQSVVLFRVATIQRTDAAFDTSYEDTLSDADLQDTERDGYGLMPVTLPSGQLNARRFEVPPGNYGVAVMFQDRAWFAVDTTGESPNSLLFSEVDEVESVPASNELVVQESVGDSDAVVALVPLASSLLICQSRHIYKLQYVAQPVLDGSILLAAYRGILNAQCWDVMGGVAFIADSYGMYAYDGNTLEPVSTPIDDLWRERVIDFSQASKFHVKADTATKVVRFYFCRSGETSTARAMCYCVATKAWWEEEYPQAVTAGANTLVNGRQDVIYGTQAGGFVRSSGYADSGSAVPFRMRTGCLPLVNTDKTSRSIGVLYTATQADATLNVGMHFNNSSSPRPNVITSDRGDGFTTINGSTVATLNLSKARSPLGDASGYARAFFSGAVEDRSAGSDRHVAVAISGQQSSASNAVILHGVTMEGVSG